MSNIPTKEQAEAFMMIYKYMNEKLFSGILPDIMLSMTKESRTVCGYFSPNTWVKKDRITHEIVINRIHETNIIPEMIVQTLVHEMVHLWQFEYGNPSRNGYHNLEWANKMESIGLIPSSTGEPGGKKCGQRMADYVEKGGKFSSAYDAMPKEYLLPWYDAHVVQRIRQQVRNSGEASGEYKEENGQKWTEKPILADAPPLNEIRERSVKNKSKYSCPCGYNVWGKPGILIICGTCGNPYEEISKE
jgi:hypothetical protein